MGSTLDQRLQAGNEATVFLRRQPKAVNRLAYISRYLPSGLLQLGEVLARRLWLAALEVDANGHRLLFDLTEHLTQPVMKLTGDTLTLVGDGTPALRLSFLLFIQVTCEAVGHRVNRLGDLIQLILGPANGEPRGQVPGRQGGQRSLGTLQAADQEVMDEPIDPERDDQGTGDGQGQIPAEVLDEMLLPDQEGDIRQG